MITQVKLEDLPSYEFGFERGIADMIKRLLKTQTPEQVAKLTELPLAKIIELNNKRI